MRWLVVLMMACTSSDPAPVRDAAPAASSTCALTGGACLRGADRCCEQTGTLFDEARGCRTTLTRTIGCSTHLADRGCIQTGMPLCVVTRQSGVRQVWLTPGQTIGWEPEERCSEEVVAAVAGAKACN